jgi:F-type H+-transporting ATPase subunit epsilon
MADPMRVEVVSPEEVLFSGEATMVITRTLGVGDIAFLPGHAPFVGALTECDTILHLVDGSVRHVAVLGGFVEVSNNKVVILSDAAELADHVDVAAAERDREAAEAELRANADDEAAARRLRGANARLSAARAARGAGATTH